MYLKYRKKYFINSELFLVKTFNNYTELFLLADAMSRNCGLVACGDYVSGDRYLSNDVNHFV